MRANVWFGRRGYACDACVEALGNRASTELTVMSSSAVKEQGTLEGMFSADAAAHIHQRVEELVNATRDRMLDAGFGVDGRVEEGEPAMLIPQILETDGYDLTVLGAGRHSWFDRFLLGSTSMRVLRRSESSVMVVHPAACSRGEGSSSAGCGRLTGIQDSRGSVPRLCRSQPL